MIVLVYGSPNSGKNHYVDNFVSRDKIVIDEAHSYNFKNHVFDNDKDYFIIIQSALLLLILLMFKKFKNFEIDLAVHCYTKQIDGRLYYFKTKKFLNNFGIIK